MFKQEKIVTAAILTILTGAVASAGPVLPTTNPNVIEVGTGFSTDRAWMD